MVGSVNGKLREAIQGFIFPYIMLIELNEEVNG